MNDTSESSLKKNFKDTLNLPATDFPIRANSAKDDPELLARWESEKLFEKSFNHNIGAKKYILHDGPPYANGDIHLGHAYNKILKDIIAKSFRMAGYHVPVTPGWDCHGLPIEIKVSKENPGLNQLHLIKACRNYALKWIEVQRLSFKKLGVLMDWQNPYITMSPGYESKTVNAFGTLVLQGYIERKNKTVSWCYSCQTVLASAEIEYSDRKDPSVYILFELQEFDYKIFKNINKPLGVAVWTTTPWTLPLNRAVNIKSNSEYVVLDIGDKLCIVGANVVNKFCVTLGIEKNIIYTFNSNILSGLKLKHPFVDYLSPILLDESVDCNEGTAAVHCAPGCGPIDYEIGVKNGLEIFSPITSAGLYDEHVLPKELIGTPVWQAHGFVIKTLQEKGVLLHKSSINHSYPHCWRCHNGLIFRATPQWFFNLEKNSVKEKAIEAINQIKFIPDGGRNFLRATVENRWEWCLSRQRAWGTPIPALICNHCDTAYTNKDLIDNIAEQILQYGIEYWQATNVQDVIKLCKLQDLSCSNCNSKDFRKENDILDVWFDAGVSNYVVLYDNAQLNYPADLYLEGVDQHRGWFQSSLITSLVLLGKSCTQAIMTHGYTVDAKGRKMSKSLGNVVSPEDVIKQIGTDGLRLWVASIGNDSDPVVSDVLFKNIAEVFRKIRNTCRFLLSNLYDFDHLRDSVSPDKLLPIDQYAMAELKIFNDTCLKAYEHADLTKVYHTLTDFCSVTLSSFYQDIVKDRLYVENGISRRSAQTVFWHILDTLTKIMAPIMSFTAEYISDNYQKNKSKSIHLQDFVTSYGQYESQLQFTDAKTWNLLKEIRSIVLKSIESERVKGVIKHSLESSIELSINLDSGKYSDLREFIKFLKTTDYGVSGFFKEFLVVSQFSLIKSLNPNLLSIHVSVASGTKCPRCWNFDNFINSDGLCDRCIKVLHISNRF